MTHARESLETFLGDANATKSSNRMSERAVVRDICPEIEQYRQRGYSLSEIYGALRRGGDLTCTLTTFRTYYYQERHHPPSSDRQLPETGGVDSISKTTASAAHPEVPQKSSEPSAGEASGSDALLTVTDDELASQQALARRLFDERRAELGMRRRGH